MKKILKIYRTENGKEPFLDWLNTLRKKDKPSFFRIRDRLNRIAEQGNYGDYKAVGEGVYELRFFFGSGYRVYFGEDGETIVLLLCGGGKSSQRQDIKKAKEYWSLYHE
ncbi:MAG: type II toxin-antitoxin system RelE/ParE family toxin [Candidatus Omnitrophota bacterium]